MAGSGRRVFVPGEVLTASNVMNYLQDQAVMNFAGTAARGSAIGTAVAEGMVSYLRDSNSVEIYDGSGWRGIDNVIRFANKAARDAWGGVKTAGLLYYVSDVDTYYYWDVSFGFRIFSKPRTVYTPTVTGATRSAGDLVYMIRNDVMHIWGQITVSAVSGDTFMTFPSGYERPATGADRLQNGISILADVGTANFSGITRTSGTAVNTFNVLASRASGTYTDFTNLSATIPFTWASGDIITVNLHSPIVEA